MTILVRKLHNGVYLPAVLLGTWQLNSEDAPAAVSAALKHGYRGVDDAWVYSNEPAVGKAVQDFDGKVTGPEKAPVKTAGSIVISEQEFFNNFSVPHGKPKDDRKVFVTSKIWVKHFEPAMIREKTDEHLRNFGRSSCDLMLLHWPGGHPGFSTPEEQQKLNNDECRITCWRTLEELYHEGKIRAIGVSNYMPKHLKPLLADIEKRKASGDKKATIPMVNQIEINPYHEPSAELQKICMDNNILFTSYSTLGGSKGIEELTSDTTLQRMAVKYNRPIYNIILRWAMQREYQILPKSSNPARVIANYDLMDFEITAEDMKEISKLDQGKCFLLDANEIA